MTQADHPIRLEQLLFTRSSVIAVPEHVLVDGQPTATPVNEIAVSKSADQPGTFSVRMQTLINPAMEKTSPYSVDMECIAILVVDDSLSEDEALRGVTITAHSVLFGAIREAVAWITARQPYGALLLGLSILQAQATTGTD